MANKDSYHGLILPKTFLVLVVRTVVLVTVTLKALSFMGFCVAKFDRMMQPGEGVLAGYTMTCPFGNVLKNTPFLLFFFSFQKPWTSI
jgi:hypothetical protein